MEILQAQKLAEEMMRAHGLDGWSFRFDNARTRFGMCRSSRVIQLSRPLVAANDETKVRETMLHEIAHALVGPAHGHDIFWRLKSREIGLENPTRCCNAVDLVMPAMPYKATCPGCGQVIGFARMPKRIKACAACCRAHNGGRFSHAYALTIERSN